MARHIHEKEEFTFALLRQNPYICRNYTTVYYTTVYFHLILNVRHERRKNYEILRQESGIGAIGTTA